MKTTVNPRCDGAHCQTEIGEVRLYPLGTGANAILCFHCWGHENIARYENGLDQRNWFQAKIVPDDFE